jgi:hypothetical protein
MTNYGNSSSKNKSKWNRYSSIEYPEFKSGKFAGSSSSKRVVLNNDILNTDSSKYIGNPLNS